MKRVVIFLIGIICASIINAQESKAPKNNFKANMLSPFYNSLNVSYERMLSSKQKSIQIGLNYMDFNGRLFSLADDYISERVNGGSITFEYRNMFGDNGFDNIYIASFMRAMYYERNARYYNYDYSTMSSSNFSDIFHDKSSYLSLGIGAVVGKQFVFNDFITLDLFAGPAFQFLLMESRKATNETKNIPAEVKSNTLLSERIPNKYISGYGIRAGLNVGFLF